MEQLHTYRSFTRYTEGYHCRQSGMALQKTENAQAQCMSSPEWHCRSRKSNKCNASAHRNGIAPPEIKQVHCRSVKKKRQCKSRSLSKMSQSNTSPFHPSSDKSAPLSSCHRSPFRPPRAAPRSPAPDAHTCSPSRRKSAPPPH